MELQDKGVVITGAGSGIGAAIARQMAEAAHARLTRDFLMQPGIHQLVTRLQALMADAP